LYPWVVPDAWLPMQGEIAYLIHAGLGGILTLTAMMLVGAMVAFFGYLMPLAEPQVPIEMD
jgi:hypothetical protein